jgi:hypothetical protein
MGIARYWLVWLSFFLMFAPGRILGQTLNMSHDLVPLGIAAQNMTPNVPTLDSTPLFQAAVNYASTHPITTLTVDQGDYYLLTNTQPNATVLFFNFSNLTVDLAGSTLYFDGLNMPGGLLLLNSTQSTLTNFQIDYVNPPYTHVMLTSIDTSNRLLRYQTLPGWADPSAFNEYPPSWTAVFRNGAIVPGTTRMAWTGTISSNTISLFQDGAPWSQGPALSLLQPGDTVVVEAGPGTGGIPISVWQCDSVTLSYISVYGSGGRSVNVHASTNSTVDHLRLVPRPGTGLISSNGDGIHFESVRQNDHITNTYVSGTMDDALIFDALYAGVVVSQGGPQQLTVMRDGYLGFPNGTAVNFVDPTTTLEFGGATIVSQNPPDPATVYGGQVTLTFNQNLPPLPAGAIMVYASPQMRGQGSTIEDCIVEDTHGGRGIWINGGEGITIARNVLRRTSMGGIIVYQETNAAGDLDDLSGPAQNVTITDNALESDLGPAACGSGIELCLSAIEVASLSDQSNGFAASAGNTNITVQNNYVADSGRSGIWIGEVASGALQNNLVIRSSQNPTFGGTFGIPVSFAPQVTQDALIPVVFQNSASVSETGDIVSTTSNITAPVTMGTPGTAVGAGAASASFTLQTAISGFAWKATSDSSWLTVTSGPLGAGNGSVQFSVAANGTGALRTASITVAGETYTVAQTAAPSVRCNITGGVTTTIVDLQSIINESLGIALAAHDLNLDGVVNVVDIQMVTDALFGLGC